MCLRLIHATLAVTLFVVTAPIFASFPVAQVDGAEAYVGQIELRSLDHGYLAVVTQGEESLTVLYSTEADVPEFALSGTGSILLDGPRVTFRVGCEELSLLVTDLESTREPIPSRGYELVVTSGDLPLDLERVRESGRTELQVLADHARGLGSLETPFDGGDVFLSPRPSCSACDLEGETSCSLSLATATCRVVCAGEATACCSPDASVCGCRR